MKFLFETLNRKHLKELKNPLLQKKIFKRSISLVEIEVFSFCNRKCWFCPNSYMDRFSNNNYMDENTYLNLLKDLQSIDYDKTISYSRYNEPLADRIILQRLEQARKALPNAALHTNTNGDYLNHDYISNLYDSGLNSLNIQIYLAKDEEFTEETISKKTASIAERINLPYEIAYSVPNEWYEIHFKFKDMTIRSYARNFEINGCNRGGLIEISDQPHIIRTSPCASVFNHIYIDYNANVMPCCNMRSDSAEHQKFILGNLQNSNIFEIYTNKKSSFMRKNLYDISPKIAPCDTCSFVEITPTEEELKKIKNVKLKSLLPF